MLFDDFFHTITADRINSKGTVYGKISAIDSKEAKSVINNLDVIQKDLYDFGNIYSFYFSYYEVLLIVMMINLVLSSPYDFDLSNRVSRSKLTNIIVIIIID